MSISNSYPLWSLVRALRGSLLRSGLQEPARRCFSLKMGIMAGLYKLRMHPSKTLIGLAKNKRKDLSFVRQIVSEVRSHEEPEASANSALKH